MASCFVSLYFLYFNVILVLCLLVERLFLYFIFFFLIINILLLVRKSNGTLFCLFFNFLYSNIILVIFLLIIFLYFWSENRMAHCFVSLYFII